MLKSVALMALCLFTISSWAYGNGSVWAGREQIAANGQRSFKLVNLFPQNKLTMPNGVLVDPQGRVYVATPTAIYRFNPYKLNSTDFQINPNLETIFDGHGKLKYRQDEFSSAARYKSLKGSLKNKHPLVMMTANSDLTELYLNIGAPSDACTTGLQTRMSNGLCAQTEATSASAAIWKLQLSNDSSRKVLTADVFARGLRNSMGLVIHPGSGFLLQAENSLDLEDTERPYEEINLVEQGKHYGWPYCHSDGVVAPAFAKTFPAKDCIQKFAKPKMFLPAHSAPLSLNYYFRSELPLQNKLLVGLHGYQKYGHRIVAISVGPDGLPHSNQPEDIVFGWDKVVGLRPRGTPVGTVTLNDGSLLIIEDLNKSLIRLAVGNPYVSGGEVMIKKPRLLSADAKNLENFQPLAQFARTNCAACHETFQKQTTREMLDDVQKDMLNLAQPKLSSFYVRLAERSMPPSPLEPHVYARIQPVLEKFIKELQ